MPEGVAIKIETTPRRVRVLFNKKIIADTYSPKFVWEHPYYPIYYLPASDIQTKYIEKIGKTGNGDEDGYECKLTVGDRSTSKVLWFEKGDLSGLIRFQFSEMGKSYLLLFLTCRCLVRGRYRDLLPSERSL
jgi:Domain of unknown function (DUF427)